MRKERVKKSRCPGLSTTPFLVALVIWLIMNLAAFSVGVSDASGRRYHCFDPMERIEYIFPGHQLGCYMGQPLGGNKYEEEK